MPRTYRPRPLATLEHGTSIYAPTERSPYYRVVTVDARTGKRSFFKLRTEDEARRKARSVDEAVGLTGSAARPYADRTVGQLAERWVEDHLSGFSRNYRNTQARLLRVWVLPRLADRLVVDWTPADSEAVLNAVRASGRSETLRQDVGACMRAMVTHARRMRWLTSRDEDPMWMVRYTPKGGIQGQSAYYIPRQTLPTDEQCNALFAAMTELGEPRWALAMRLKHRSGLRWSELTAVQANDLEFEPARIVRVLRASEPGEHGGRVLKAPKNGRTRTTIFPRSMCDDLLELRDEIMAEHGPCGLLFPSKRGKIMDRGGFQGIWARSAETAGWEMKRAPTQTKPSGWKGLPRDPVTSDLWCRRVPLEGCSPCPGPIRGSSART